jgi:hypothetical protein
VGDTFARVTQALKIAFVEVGGEGQLSRERDCYVCSAEDNLVLGVALSDFWDDLAQGDGSELHPRGKAAPKFCALYSSSALVVNSFGPFKCAPGDLVIGGDSGFKAIGFEFKCKNGLRGKNPNLDLLAVGHGRVLGVESKFTEILSVKPADFSQVYDEAVRAELPEPWTGMFQLLRSDSRRFRFLDAAQLVKHALGLAHHFSVTGESQALLYLYWEPRNAAEIEEFASHREEVASFSGDVENGVLEFCAMSYLELWREWEREFSNPNLLEHVGRLRQRYELII